MNLPAGPRRFIPTLTDVVWPDAPEPESEPDAVPSDPLPGDALAQADAEPWMPQLEPFYSIDAAPELTPDGALEPWGAEAESEVVAFEQPASGLVPVNLPPLDISDALQAQVNDLIREVVAAQLQAQQAKLTEELCTRLGPAIAALVQNALSVCADQPRTQSSELDSNGL
jgi:hypothetical protein